MHRGFFTMLCTNFTGILIRAKDGDFVRRKLVPFCILALAAITISLAVFFIRSLMPDRCADVCSIEVGDLRIITEFIDAIVVERFTIDRDRILFDIVNNSSQNIYNLSYHTLARNIASLEYYCNASSVWRSALRNRTEWTGLGLSVPPTFPGERIEMFIYLSDNCPPSLTPGVLYRVRRVISVGIFNGRERLHDVVLEFYWDFD